MYKAMDLSNYIISKCIKDNEPINNFQLQAILYYIQKCFLTNWLKKDLIAFDDNIEARSFGPCIPDVYYHFSIYGCMPITENYEHFDIEDDFHKVIIDEVIEKIRNLDLGLGSLTYVKKTVHGIKFIEMVTVMVI